MVEQWLWCLIGVVVFFVLVAFIYFSIGLIKTFKSKRMLARWSRATKNSDKLIVHCPPRAKTCPSPSPFVMKLLTYLRMAGIPYELDHKDPFGGKGKSPWISYQGENLADSEFIIAFIAKKFGKNLNGPYTDEQLATATAVRIMVEEHLFWGMALERFVFGGNNILEVTNIPFLVRKIIKRVVTGRAQNQGIGAHSQEDIVDFMCKDLRILSKILGNKQYICGDEPCTEDAAIFGQLSQFYWALPNSPYSVILNGDASNLREYCFRVRERFWQDWK